MGSYVLRYNSHMSPGSPLQEHTIDLKPNQTDSDLYILTCSVCNKKFVSMLNFRIHAQSHLLKKPYQCSRCCRQYHSKFELKDHDCITGEIPFTCGVCSVSFSAKQEFTEHLRIHCIQKTNKCSRCGEEFSGFGKPKPHACVTRKDTGVAKTAFECEVCKRQFFSKLNFSIHQRVHADGPVLNCQDCHAQIPLENWQDHTCLPFKVQHVCRICFVDCITRMNLMHHKLLHIKDRGDHCCFACNKRYFKKATLIIHSQKHEKRDLYCCVHCNKRFSYKAFFLKHSCPISNLAPKPSESNLALSQTSFSSGQSQNSTSLLPLKAHGGVQAPEQETKPYCEMCDKYFRGHGALKTHLAWHDRPRPFSCSSCEKKFSSKSGLLVHYKNHSELPFICKFCTKAFSKTEDLSEHLLAIHAGIDKYRCDVCEGYFHSKRELHIHYSVHTGKPIYNCKHCKKQFYERSVLRSHEWLHNSEEDLAKCSKCHKVFRDLHGLKLHNQGELHQCNFCNRSFCLSAKLKSHIKFRHSQIKPYKCTFCPHAFSEQSKLVVHLQNHANIRPYGCNICEKKFHSMHFLKCHLSTHASDEQRKLFVCDVCEKRFYSRSRLKSHQRSHTGEKPYMCEICGKLFSCAGGLGLHKKTHLEDKPFKCNLCDKGFSYKWLFQQHQYKHTSERPFKCKLCDKAYKSGVSLQNHQYSHGFERPFQCNVCGKGFIYKFMLEKHLRVQHSPNQKNHFKCEKCQKNFAHPNSLRKHMLTHEEKS